MVTHEEPRAPVADAFKDFPFYKQGAVPQYHRYHAEVSYLDELERVWGKKWGAQGIGQLREVAMVKPTESEVLQLYEQDSAFFVFNGITPNLELMREQHHNLGRLYESRGVKVHEIRWADDPPRSAYGPMKRGVSAAAGFVINGGAEIYDDTRAAALLRKLQQGAAWVLRRLRHAAELRIWRAR